MKDRNLFHNASVKLTSVYLLIIMLISFLFSFDSYVRYSNEIEQNILRPLPQSIRRLPIEDLEEFLDDREVFVDKAKVDYRNRLILLNGLILLAGGLISYHLARRTLKPIEEAHEAQSRFTADASHELRTPITAMRTETELALMDKKLTLKKSKQQLQSNLEELDKLTALSDGLLQVARLNSDYLEKQVVDVSDLVQQAVDHVLKRAEKKKQIINTKKISNTSIIANRAGIVEALVILLDNAIKFSPEKSEITIATKSQLKTLELSVSDKGVGIKSSDLPHIFDRFYQADSSRSNSGEQGYGIGLSIARSIAESHEGSIFVKSKAGKGSMFIISLPL